MLTGYLQRLKKTEVSQRWQFYETATTPELRGQREMVKMQKLGGGPRWSRNSDLSGGERGHALQVLTSRDGRRGVHDAAGYAKAGKL